jgi:hypothetical protein
MSLNPVQANTVRRFNKVDWEFHCTENDFATGETRVIIRRNNSSIPDFCTWEYMTVFENGTTQEGWHHA